MSVIEPSNTEPATVPAAPVTTNATVRIRIDELVVPANRRRAISADDDDALRLLDSMRRLGMLEPIAVRPLFHNGKYEVVFGRRRLWVAKKLGWTELECSVRAWNDEQISLVALAENAHRQHMKPAEHAKCIQKLLAELERCFGPDKGRAAGALARERKHGRDPETGTFAKAKPESEGSTSNHAAKTAVSPASATDADAGAPPELGHTALLANMTGRSDRSAADDRVIAKSFRHDQLESLLDADLTRDHLLTLAKMSEECREVAVIDIVNGTSPDVAIEAALKKGSEPTPEEIEARKVRDETNLSDEEWLEAYCGTLRSKLRDPSRFDMDALEYRESRDLRERLRATRRASLVKCKKRAFTPLIHMIASTCWVDHPSTWFLCSHCNGQGRVRNSDEECENCRGCGYRLKVSIPKEIRNS